MGGGSQRPEWDAEMADSVIGKTLLVGITYLDPDGSETGRDQFHGIIVEASEEHGIVIACQGDRLGERRSLPADLTAVQPADPGHYRLKTTGEVIIDPDFTTTWTLRRSAS
jgi:hypothetical protein